MIEPPSDPFYSGLTSVRLKSQNPKYWQDEIDYDPRRRWVGTRPRHLKVKELLNFYKEVLGCTDCGTHDVRILDFHHIDPATANRNRNGRVIHGTEGCRSFEGAFREVEKCVVLCANCHRIRESKKVKSNA